MKPTICLLSIILTVVTMTAAKSSTSESFSDFLQLMRMLSKPRQLDRNKNFVALLTEAKLRRDISGSNGFLAPVLKFSWSNCGSSSDIAQVKSLSISPDPIHLPGQIKVSATVVLSKDVGISGSPISVTLEMQKKVLFWISLPCVDNVGSCTYNNACGLDPYKNKTCPPIFVQNKMPCKCPFTKGKYEVSNLEFNVKLPSNVPSWLSTGDYKLNAKVSTGREQIACVDIEASLK